MGTLLTTGKFAKDGLIPWKPALAGVIFAFAGSSLGAHIALILDARIFMTAMLFILPVTAFYVTRKKSMAEKEPFPFQKTVLLSCTMAFVIGIYDGFYGPGTGTFLILLLMGVAHVRLKDLRRRHVEAYLSELRKVEKEVKLTLILFNTQSKIVYPRIK